MHVENRQAGHNRSLRIYTLCVKMKINRKTERIATTTTKTTICLCCKNETKKICYKNGHSHSSQQTIVRFFFWFLLACLLWISQISELSVMVCWCTSDFQKWILLLLLFPPNATGSTDFDWFAHTDRLTYIHVHGMPIHTRRIHIHGGP